MASSGAKLDADVEHKPIKGGWNSAIFIIFVEVVERFSFFGIAGNLIIYFTVVLGLPTATAAQTVNLWQGISFLLPLLGAFVADAYLGRYATVLYASIVYIIGLALLVISVSIVPIHLRYAFVLSSLYIISIGEGGHKPCVQTFAADQFNEDTPEEKAKKSSFFNWWFSGIVFGGGCGLLVVILVQKYVGWAIGYGIPLGAMILAFAIFIIGTKYYSKQGPLGSPFTRVAQVFVAAIRKRGARIAESGGVLKDDDCEGNSGVESLAQTKNFRCLDKASVLDENDKSAESIDPWRLCSTNQIEEVKLVIRVLPIWLTSLSYGLTYAQLGTFFIKQASTMNLSVGGSNSKIRLPPALLLPIFSFSTWILITIYDRVFVPFARRITGHQSGITILTRIGIGYILAATTMVIAALVESKRVRVARDHGLLDNVNPKMFVPMSLWWLFPQLFIFAVSETFTVVGLQEIFYDQMPSGLRSLGAALYISTFGAGSVISSWFISIVEDISASNGGSKWLVNNLNRAHLDNYYWVIAGINALNFLLYFWIAKKFVYKKQQ